MTPEEELAVSLQDHKIAVLIKDNEGAPRVAFQAELNVSKARKKPFNVGDALMVKILISLLF